jgi:hypothetical protein
LIGPAASACNSNLREAATVHSLSDDERNVLQKAVSDFSHEERCNPDHGGKIVVGLKSTSSDGLGSGEWLAEWLSPKLWKRLSPLIATLREKNATSLTLDWAPLTAADVRVVDLDKVHGPRYLALSGSARCLLTFMLPAFSIDRTQALVLFSVAPTEHGTKVLYLLEKRQLTG